jgi:cytochrome c oxidase subunit 3
LSVTNLPTHAPPHHPLALLHHFDTTEQQKNASTLGMWLFLVTEIMFFGGMFTAYIVYRTLYPQAFVEASHELNLTMGAINTAVLIGSSLSMALAVRAAQVSDRAGQVVCLLLTILLGTVFLGIKAVEYHEKYVSHHIPGPSFHFEGPNAPHAEMFFCLYFGMTGLHAAHMVIGIVLLAILTVRAYRGAFNAEYNTPVDMTGLYWHFVDIVWIFLFPLLYLLGGHLKGA